jgi:hypothetical protein
MKKKHVYREKCNGGIVVFFRKWLSQYVEIVKCVADCMIWFKFDKCIMPNNKNVHYICMPTDNLAHSHIKTAY